MNAAINFALEQTRRFQYAQVLGDRGQGNLEGLGQLGDGGFALRQAGQDGAAGGVRQRSKCRVE